VQATKQSVTVALSVHVVEEGSPSSLLLPSDMVGGVVQPGGMQGKVNLGRPGSWNQVLGILGKFQRMIPEPDPPHFLQPTRTGTMVGSEESPDVVVIQVLDVHSGCPLTVEGANSSGASVTVGNGASPVAVVVRGAGFEVTDGLSPFFTVVEGVLLSASVVAAASVVVTPMAVEGPSLSDETATAVVSEFSAAG
jgi:hypothetical protein